MACIRVHGGQLKAARNLAATLDQQLGAKLADLLVGHLDRVDSADWDHPDVGDWTSFQLEPGADRAVRLVARNLGITPAAVVHLALRAALGVPI